MSENGAKMSENGAKMREKRSNDGAKKWSNMSER
jgi:hypothetical protein